MAQLARPRPIVLLTDFGTRDQYVGQVKAVLAGIAPEAPLIDLFHDVEPFAIDEAAWVLETTLPVLPEGAVILGVVDPGVGTARRPIVLHAGGRFFVGPDNGLFSPVLPCAAREELTEPARVRLDPACTIEIRELCDPQFRRPAVSDTFHGRDIFAPAAAHLANGADYRRLGPPVEDPIALPAFSGRPAGSGALEGYVVHVDHYGNLVTTIRASQLFPSFALEVGGTLIDRRVRTFGDALPGSLFCHADSSGFVAIAVNRGSAAATLGVGRGARVRVSAA
ncbi:MAG: S-adenosyl-l-methionine hydroxide adenosyltransferase family protein [Hyphomicrobiales bacterium]